MDKNKVAEIVAYLVIASFVVRFMLGIIYIADIMLEAIRVRHR
jgi:hypothetical protein